LPASSSVRARSPGGTTIELLVPIFCGNGRLAAVMAASRMCGNHNIEDGAQAFTAVRPGDLNARSWKLLQTVREGLASRLFTKSG